MYSPVDRNGRCCYCCQEGQGILYHKIVYSDGKVSWIDLKAEKVLIDDDGNLNATVANPGVDKRAQTGNHTHQTQPIIKMGQHLDINDNAKGCKKNIWGQDKFLSGSSSVKKMSCAGEVIEPAALREAVNHCGGYDEVVLRRHWQKYENDSGYDL